MTKKFMGNIDLRLAALRQHYMDRAFTPGQLITYLLERAEALRHHNTWIHLMQLEEIEPYLHALQDKDPTKLPLYGVPFAIKDNIDLCGIPTTAACAEFAYTPSHSATVVRLLIEAGAIPLGKTNLDQFATGLVGVRSPYGPGRNAINADYISGGSSAGSAIAVAQGLVSFSLGTDTAGSGRVPAAFNNIVGVKPTRGLLSTSGVVPACRSLDCVSIFAMEMTDAAAVWEVAAEFDQTDAYARPTQRPSLGTRAIPAEGFRYGIPRPGQLAFFDNIDTPHLFETATECLAALGGVAVEIDFAPFLECARLLYEGPWVAERYAAIEDFIKADAQALFPVTRGIITSALDKTAVSTFQGMYRLQELLRRSESVWQDVDVILTPTAGTIYKVAEVEANPIQLNSNLGYYTNFMNLLDLAAVAVPAGFQRDGLPFGVTLFAPAFLDRELMRLGERLHRSQRLPLGATQLCISDTEISMPSPGDEVLVAVCGAHMSGLPLNHQLTRREARLISRTHTSPHYRFYALPGGPPKRPGLLRVVAGGAAIALEVWSMPSRRLGEFIQDIPAPLGIGSIELADGSRVPGFLCEAYAVEGAEEITYLGSWRDYLTHQTTVLD